MADICSINVNGRLVAQAEQSYTQGGFPVVKFVLANNYRKKFGDEWRDEVSFFEVTYFGQKAEKVCNLLVKSQTVSVTGKLRQSRWENQAGEKRSKISIEADYVQLIGRPPEPKGFDGNVDFNDPPF